MKISDLRPADYNPREIDDASLKGLQSSIANFGDIAGITYNLTTQRLVSGHQRVTALIAKYGDVEIRDGKIVCGNGDEFAVRFVEWDESREKAANIAANSPFIAGRFTPDLFTVLDDVKVELPELAEDLRFDELYTLPFDAIEGAGQPKDKTPQEVTCPHCGASFTPQSSRSSGREAGQNEG